MAEDETFKVTDRRGRAEDAGPPEPREAAAPPTAATPRASDGPGPGTPAGGGRRAGPDLQAIFMMFVSSALINLGVAADPVTGGRRVDMEQARGAIDALLLLRDKTAGNRTDEESQFLEQIVYDLQMWYVRVTTPGDAQPPGP
jgi:hypothetical protein